VLGGPPLGGGPVTGGPPLGGPPAMRSRPAEAVFRVDLVTVIRQGGGAGWRIGRHVQGLAPP
jgi:hypothetical protein